MNTYGFIRMVENKLEKDYVQERLISINRVNKLLEQLRNEKNDNEIKDLMRAIEFEFEGSNLNVYGWFQMMRNDNERLRLSSELKKLQNQRNIYYKMSRYFLDKMSYNSLLHNDDVEIRNRMSYIDYLNMVQIKKRIEENINESKILVRKIWG